MKEKENNVFNNRIVINHNYGTVTRPQIVNQQTVKTTTGDLYSQLLDFLDKLEEEDFDLPQQTRQSIIEQADRLLSELEDGTASKNRLKQFHDFLYQSMPEMQLVSTCSGVISALSDLLK